MERVELPRTVAIELLQLAQASAESEICGLVAANGEALRIIPVRNAAVEPDRLFEMDERELIDAMKSMRERGERLFAIYHSHPRSAPVPSATDLERAGYPEALHLIISMETRGVLQMRGWRFDGATPRAIEVGVREHS